MQVENILSLLNGVRRSGGGWTARCPAHPDRTPSLSVGEGERGVLVHCWAGCASGDVCQALGIRLVDLFYNTTRLPRARSQAVQAPPDRRLMALAFELHADKLTERAEVVFNAARGLDCTTWNEDDFDAAMDAVGRATHDHEYAQVLFDLADAQRVRAYQEAH